MEHGHAPLRTVPVPRGGHRVALLQGSAEFFAALVEAIEGATREVRLETYIYDFTGAAAEVSYALERAARRGVAVMVAVDGFGTPAEPGSWIERFAGAGVQWRVFDRPGRLGLLWPGSWRRLHRKLCVVDEAIAFCGGINILDDLHDPNHGQLDAPRFDFAVRVTGPLVAEARDSMARLWLRMRVADDVRHARLAGALTSWRAGAGSPAPQKPMRPRGAACRAALVLRDNLLHRAQIERSYRRAIGRAKVEVIIANAYFVPGRRMRKALITAARRGVKVKLLLQGRYEYFMQYYASRPVYGALLRSGIEIHEYATSFLHAKVAVVDGRWATVGSSNLDPLSLLLAREANVMVEHAGFASDLQRRLEHAIEQHGRRMQPDEYAQRPLVQRIMEHVALALMRVALMIQGKTYL